MNNINQWCGRFGNNVQQLLNALYFFEKNNTNFNSPEHEVIKPIKQSFGIDKPIYSRFFFHTKSITGQGGPDFFCDLPDIRKSRRRFGKIIYDNLKFNLLNIKKLKSNQLVIHIRSGDIFEQENFNCPVKSFYVQNPLSYYRDIIKQYDDIIILAEDKKHPLIKELLKLPNTRLVVCSFFDSISILLSTENLVTCGISSFPIACSAISQNIVNLYCSNICVDEIINYKDLLDQDINVHMTYINKKNYIKLGEWKNTKEQVNLMLNYE